MESEIQNKADFSLIKYSQCWEDTNLVINTLAIKPGDICLSIAAAGDNTLSLLTRGPQQVVALDLSPCQLNLLKLKVCAIKELTYFEFLTLFGYDQNIEHRLDLYNKIKAKLEPDVEHFWTEHSQIILCGIADSGKLEKYFKIFRKRILPLIHNNQMVGQLFKPRSRQKRAGFYQTRWNTPKWRLASRLFFSRYSLGKIGRDASFFEYADNSLSKQIATKLKDALVAQEPRQNPYLHWILLGRYDFENGIVPYWLEPSNYEKIKVNIDRLEIKQDSLEGFLSSYTGPGIDCFNLSDIFEYMSGENFLNCLALIVSKSSHGARLAYFNMLVDRISANKNIVECPNQSVNQTFFYSRFIAEKINKGNAA